MENELNVEGLSIASGVVETIIALAAAEVKGVAGIGSGSSADVRSRAFRGSAKPASSGIEVAVDEAGKLDISLRIQAYYGYRLGDVADQVRDVVSDAVQSQVGVSVGSIDILVDDIVFAN